MDLIGSAIISGAEKSKNRLNAKEFSYSNIQNDSSANASSMGLGLGIAVNGTGEPPKYLTAQNPKPLMASIYCKEQGPLKSTMERQQANKVQENMQLVKLLCKIY